MKNQLITILLILIVYLFQSCGSNKIFVDKIKSFHLEYDESRNLYFGDTITLNAYVIKKSGEKIDLSRSRQFELIGEGFKYDKQERLLTIDNRPNSIDINKIVVTGKLKDDNDAEKSIDKELPISFNHPVTINFNGISGNDSRNRADRVIGRALLTDGKKGRDGDDGTDGEDAKPIQAYIWKENDFYAIRVNFTDSTENYYFRTKYGDKITITTSGGDGGDGGDGGNGGRGKRGNKSKDREPGNGGDGGNGGNGAIGGDGALIEIFIHPNAKEIKNNLTLIYLGGKAGQGGLAGEAGEGGKGASGQEDGKSGENGKKGNPGAPGLAGPDPKVTIESFDIKQM